MKRILLLTLAISGCSSPYDIRISDDKSASNGALFFFGWADPPLIPGTRLADAPHGSRVVLWNEAGLEAIVDIGDACPVLVRDRDGARAPAPQELEVIAAVFPNWPLEASTQASAYAGERRLERRFPSHIQAYVETLDEMAAVPFAVGDQPAGWLATGGRKRAMLHAAAHGILRDLDDLVDGTRKLDLSDRKHVLRGIAGRSDLRPSELLHIVAAGAPEIAVTHLAANEDVCLAAVEKIEKEPLSSDRRSGLEEVLKSPGVTDLVRKRALEVPLAYPEDRDAIRRLAEK